MIRTVLGDIKTPCGNILLHEHIWCVSNDMMCIKKESWVDKKAVEDYCVNILKELKERVNLGVFVDGTPWDLGRDVDLLKNISERSGVHIVASSGLYYFTSLISFAPTAEELAQMFIDECEHGIEGTNIKTGILKCAAGGNTLTADEKKRIKALGIAQKETALPLYVHSFHQENVTKEIIDILEKSGACLDKVVIGHTGLRPEAEYLNEVLKTGVNISIDQCFPGHEKDTAKTVAELCRNGWSNKIMCSLDHVIYSDFCQNSQKGLGRSYYEHVNEIEFVFKSMLPEFEKAGCTKEQCADFVNKNPFQFLDI